jgi:hypothetical protein
MLSLDQVENTAQMMAETEVGHTVVMEHPEMLQAEVGVASQVFSQVQSWVMDNQLSLLALEVELVIEKGVLEVENLVDQVNQVEIQEHKVMEELVPKVAMDNNSKVEMEIVEVNKLQAEMPWTDQAVEPATSVAKEASPTPVPAEEDQVTVILNTVNRLKL